MLLNSSYSGVNHWRLTSYWETYPRTGTMNRGAHHIGGSKRSLEALEYAKGHAVQKQKTAQKA